MTSFAEDSDPDANLDTGEEYFGDSDPDANSDTGEELIGYSDPDADLDTGEEFFGLMFKSSSSDEEDSDQNSDLNTDSDLDTGDLYVEEISMQQEFDEQTATKKTQRLSQQLSVASPIVEDDIVPPEIKLMSDKKFVPMYLKLLDSGSEKKRDIRLVIIGKKGAGKTSLLKRLFGEKNGMVTSTNGIEIHRVKCHAETNDGIWNKLKDNSEEAELNTRLLKPFEKKINSQTNNDALTERTGLKVLKDNKPKGIDETLHRTKQMNSSFPSSFKLQTSKNFVSSEMQPKHQVEQVHKQIESMLKVYSHDKEEYATLLLWDFAGDKEFYHTHQTFLSANAIYLVVTKLNEADDKEAQDMFRLWMDSIHCYCRPEKQNTMSDINTAGVKDLTDQQLHPPVILVGTYKDQIEIAEGKEMENSCMEKLGTYTADVSVDVCRHVVEDGKFCISNTEDKKKVFKKIRENILKLARTMKSWNTDYPLKFIQLEKLLREKKEDMPIISFQQILDLSTATPNPLTDEELSLFLKYHHEIRELVFFDDLPDYIILDTQWLSDAFKCIVTADKFQWKMRSIKNNEKWNELNQRGILHDEVLEDIFKKQTPNLSKHRDHILNVMEKFDIIIRPMLSERDVTNEKTCYYVPCMVKGKPEGDIYEMFKVMANKCKKSTWFCLKFTFLPPHLMNHLIASLCRGYEISKFADTIQDKKLISLFRGTVVFDLEKTRLQKLLVTTSPNLIQIQVLDFKTNAVIKRGSYSHLANLVEGEIMKIISTRYKMTNVKFEKKWECGCVKPESVKGSIDFTEENSTEYFCETCTVTHKFIDEWSNKQSQKRGSKRKKVDGSGSPKKNNTSRKTQYQLSQQFGEANLDTAYSKPTVIAAKLHFPSGALNALSRKNSLRVFTKEEFNYAKMVMIVQNVLADVLFDLLKQDRGGNVKPRSECDVTYLYGEHRNLNKHIPSYSVGRRNPWGGTWQDLQNADIGTGDDIERIRLTRNELQHSNGFKLEDARYKDMCNIIDDLLKRFDRRNNPTKLYAEQLKDILCRTLSDEEVNGVQSEMAIEIEIEHQMNIPP